jgi:hypothetical protein
MVSKKALRLEKNFYYAKQPIAKRQCLLGAFFQAGLLEKLIK